jgi:heme oxygenase
MTIADPGLRSAPVATRMQRLREATRNAHMRIEGALPLLDPKLSRTRYIGVVARFYGFYSVVEPRLLSAAGANAGQIELGRRAKLPLLALDLQALGSSAARIAALPCCADVPLTVTPSQALGVLYVLEGATLGGQVIGRNLRAGLGLDSSNGAAFFGGYGDETRLMWRLFSEHVDRSSSLDVDVLAGSAVDTFEKLLAWLVSAVKS